ncbi:hypothetical protein [Xanthomonas phage JGB6]|nr:hypothetical protein [Xanthomonas phage JGB6]
MPMLQSIGAEPQGEQIPEEIVSEHHKQSTERHHEEGHPIEFRYLNHIETLTGRENVWQPCYTPIWDWSRFMYRVAVDTTPCPDEGCPHYGTQHSHTKARISRRYDNTGCGVR